MPPRADMTTTPLDSFPPVDAWDDWTELDPAAWPKRTDVRSLVDRAVCANDTPLPLEAEVVRGYRSGMRVRVHYHLVDDQGETGPTQTLIMTEQKRRPALQRDGSAPEPPRHTFSRLVEIADGSRVPGSASLPVGVT